MGAEPIMFTITLTDDKKYTGALGDNHGWYIDNLKEAQRHAYYFIEFLIFKYII